MRVISLFSGVAGLDLGIKLAIPSATTIAYVENDRYCQKVISARIRDGWLTNAPIYGNILTFDAKPFRGRCELVAGGFPCFTAGTHILTWEGYRPIETLVVGDRVLTHTGRWKRVTAVMQRDAHTTRVLRGQGFPDIRTTDEHPFYIRRRGRHWDNDNRNYRRTFAAPAWASAEEITTSDYVGQVLPVEPVDCGKDDEHFWWLIGRYLADGWRTVSNKKGRVIICAAHSEADAVEERIRRVFPCCRSNERTVVKFHITRIGFHEWTRQFGRMAGGKLIPGWVLGLPPAKAAALLDGYLTGDGCRYQNRTGSGGGWTSGTVSRALALGVALLAQRAWGIVASIHEYTPANLAIIEDRQVSQQRRYQVVIPDRNRSAFVEGEYGWKLVRSNEPEGPARVWNISVEEDESYVADGVIVHNCQDISNAGKREGIRHGNRSGLWFQFERVIREVRPRYVFVENVSALLVRGMDVVLGSLAELRYDAEWCVLSASAVGAPQLRKRLFLLAYLADAPGDDLGDDGLRSAIGADPGGRLQTGDIGRPLAHPEGGSSGWEAGERSEAWESAGRRSEAVGEPTGEGLEIGPGERGDDEQELPAAERTGLPLFPPGPGDADGWAAILREYPDLAPAVERPVRLLAAELPAGMDRPRRSSRIDQLRALGNSVVVAQGAFALVTLARRIECSDIVSDITTPT